MGSLPKHVILIFLNELTLLGKNARRAAIEIENALRDDTSAAEIFRWLEIFLNCSAKMSLILWPDRSGDAERGDMLRRLLAIDDQSPLRSREARNNLQHFDQRLDAWIKETGGRIYIDNQVIERGDIRGAKAQGNVLRLYDPDNERFIFLGKEFDIKALSQAADAATQTAFQMRHEIEREMFSHSRSPPRAG